MYLFRSYLSDRVNKIQVFQTLLNPFTSTVGVPQGSIWGSLPYKLFVRDISQTPRWLLQTIILTINFVAWVHGFPNDTCNQIAIKHNYFNVNIDQDQIFTNIITLHFNEIYLLSYQITLKQHLAVIWIIFLKWITPWKYWNSDETKPKLWIKNTYIRIKSLFDPFLILASSF